MTFLKLGRISAAFSILSLLFTKATLAQADCSFLPQACLPDSDVKLTLRNPTSFGNLGPLLTVLILIALTLAGLLFLVQFMVGGIAWITAGGDPKNVAAARSRLTNAFIGLVLVVATYAIIRIIEQVLGINIVSGIDIRP